jgi:exodeoxyribonuclease VII large subunit
MGQLSFLSEPVMSVSELTRHVRELLENDQTLRDIWVRGEVSNLSRPTSGHLYFTLKDNSAALRCVMWRNAVLRQPLLPQDGEAVEVHGYISVYEAGGQYQLYADLFRSLGEGELYQAFLRLKERLEAEGLFDVDRKRPIPHWPHRIGLVTSPTGAALRDILNTLKRRYPLATAILAPTPVQGDEAPGGIITALNALNQFASPDVIILARGGGSLEDLWAFNDEGVARAIAASPVPVITGVGHETDFTIADFVADLRAPTPTAAAELAAPNQVDLYQALSEQNQRLARSIQTILAEQRWEVSGLSNKLLLYSPRPRLLSERQRLDETQHRLETAIGHWQQLAHTRLESVSRRLASLNPLAVLERGFALVSHPDGKLVHSSTQVTPGDPLDVRMHDGTFQVQVRQSGSSRDA